MVGCLSQRDPLKTQHYSKGFTNHFKTIELLNMFTKVFIAKVMQNEKKCGW